MSSTLLSGILHNFKNDFITFDKFQIVKIIKDAVNKVSMLERRGFAMLKGY
jgi:transposase